MACHASTQRPAYHFDIPTDSLSCLLESCNQSLQVSEVWVVHEPIPQLEQAVADWGKGLTRAAAKHYFLVFVLERGQKFWDKDPNTNMWVCDEYQYMRVERQQQVTASNTAGANNGLLGTGDSCPALLNIRFCRDPTVVLGLDIPGRKPWELTAADLKQYDISLPDHRRAQLSIVREGWFRFILDVMYPRLKLGMTIKTLLDVHNSKRTYSLSGANCIWFVESVLRTLAASAHGQQAHELNALLEIFKKTPRYKVAEVAGPLIEFCVKEFAALFGETNSSCFASQPSDAARLSKAAVLASRSSRLGSQGAVLATRLAFQGPNSSPYYRLLQTQRRMNWWHVCITVLVLVLCAHKFDWLARRG